MMVNNQVKLVGELISEFKYNHEVKGEKFYTANMRCERSSGNSDFVPVMVSGRLMNMSVPHVGEVFEINGRFRSYSLVKHGKSHLCLHVFARDITPVDTNAKHENYIYLCGEVCKQPTYRTTPLGREIADMLIRINGTYNRRDIIPCICWGRNARYAKELLAGEVCTLHGRIQSREYKKTTDEGVEMRIAYEVSVDQML